jgi:hypothetical protein
MQGIFDTVPRYGVDCEVQIVDHLFEVPNRLLHCNPEEGHRFLPAVELIVGASVLANVVLCAYFLSFPQTAVQLSERSTQLVVRASEFQDPSSIGYNGVEVVLGPPSLGGQDCEFFASLFQYLSQTARIN